MITIKIKMDSGEEAEDFIDRLVVEFGDPTTQEKDVLTYEDATETLAEFLTMIMFEGEVILQIKMDIE